MKIKKNSGKQSKNSKNQRFDEDLPARKGVKKDRSSKRKLSIYDDFDDDQDFDDVDFNSTDNSYYD